MGRFRIDFEWKAAWISIGKSDADKQHIPDDLNKLTECSEK